MDVDVSVTDAGLLQVSVDGVSWPPLPIEIVPVMVQKTAEANAAAARQQVTAGMRTLTDVLAASGAAAMVQVGDEEVSAEIDEDSFVRAQQILGVTPDPRTGELRSGRIVIRRRVKQEPEPEAVTGGGEMAAPQSLVALEPIPTPNPGGTA